MTWTHIKDSTVTARKRHVCQLCGKYVQPGTKYISRFGFDDGPAWAAMHIACEALTHDWDETDWETHSPGDGDWPSEERQEAGT